MISDQAASLVQGEAAARQEAAVSRSLAIERVPATHIVEDRTLAGLVRNTAPRCIDAL